MEVYQQAMEVSEDKTEVLSHLMHIAYDEHEFEKAADYAKQMIELSPGNYQGFLTLAYAYFSMYQDREAYNAVEKAMDLCRSDLSVYVLKARILIRNNAEGGAQEIVDFIARSGLEEDPSVKYLRGLIEEDCHTNPEAAGQLYDEALKTIEEEQRREEYTADLVYRLLCIKAEGLNANEEKDRNYMLELCDKGLKADPEYYGLLDYKAWLLVRAKEYDEALKIYMHLLDNPYHGPAVEAQIGYIYYQDLEHKADLSLTYYEKSLANEGAPSGHFYAGMCCMYMNRLDEAEEHFLKLRENNPDSLDASFRLSFVYAMKNDLPKALECAKKATAIVNAQGNRPVQYYLREVTLLRRMRRVDEAVEILEHIRDKYAYRYADKLIFRTYCQAGRFDDAKAYLKKWAKKEPNDPELCDCGILLHMYHRNFNAASLEYRMVKKHLDADRALEIDQILSEYYGDFQKQYKELQKWLEYRKKNDGFDICRILGAVAMNCFRLGDQESAEYYANKALEEIDEKLKEFETDKLLFMARKLRLLAILGKKEEERELLKECGKMPLCQSCPERTCKDVDIFKMEAEEVFGNYNEAYIMALEGQKQYPDEEDFLIAERLLKKKAG
jgi:tetratricopeptide (TPR) repeat protein